MCIKRSNRWFWRCSDCLRVVAVNERVGEAKCGVCNGRMECMGQVIGSTLATVGTACACDARCTHAKGPNCECSCGGENHGTGAVVEVIRVVGTIPQLGGTGTKNTADEFRTGLAVIERELNHLLSLNRWLSNDEYSRKCRLERVVRKARSLRTHAARMRLIRECVPVGVE